MDAIFAATPKSYRAGHSGRFGDNTTSASNVKTASHDSPFHHRRRVSELSNQKTRMGASSAAQNGVTSRLHEFTTCAFRRNPNSEIHGDHKMNFHHSEPSFAAFTVSPRLRVNPLATSEITSR